MAQENSSVKERQNINLDVPRQYKVIIFNDDFTTMEFVVKVLRTVFFKSEADAESLMLMVHQKGQAIVGFYTLDVAASKVRKATDMARAEHFPLRLTYSPAE